MVIYHSHDQELPAYMTKTKWSPSPPSSVQGPDYNDTVILCDSPLQQDRVGPGLASHEPVTC